MNELGGNDPGFSTLIYGLIEKIVVLELSRKRVVLSKDFAIG